jgi:hypothetical protein
MWMLWVNTMIQLDVMPSCLCSSLVYLSSDWNELPFKVSLVLVHWMFICTHLWQQQPKCIPILLKYSSHSIHFMIKAIKIQTITQKTTNTNNHKSLKQHTNLIWNWHNPIIALHSFPTAASWVARATGQPTSRVTPARMPSCLLSSHVPRLWTLMPRLFLKKAT